MKANVIYSYNRDYSVLVEEWQNPAIPVGDQYVLFRNDICEVLSWSSPELYFSAYDEIVLFLYGEIDKKVVRYHDLPIHKIRTALAVVGVALCEVFSKVEVPVDFKFKNELEYIII